MPTELEKTIGEMLASFDGPSAPEAPVEDSATTTEPAPEPEPAPELAQEQFAFDDSETPEPLEASPQAEAAQAEPESDNSTEPDLYDLVRRQQEMLTAQQEWIASMQLQQKGLTAGPHSRGAEPQALPTAPAPAPTVAPQPPRVPKLELAQFEQVLNSPELFQQYMEQVRKAAADEALETVMSRVGGLVNQTVSHHVSVSAMVSNFFKDNADLLPYRNQVGIIANELIAGNPAISYSDLFRQTNMEARKRLQPLLAASKLPRLQRPGFAGRQPTVRSQKAKAPLDPMQAEIEELLALQ